MKDMKRSCLNEVLQRSKQFRGRWLGPTSLGRFIQLRLVLPWVIPNLGQSDLGKLLRIPVRTKPSLYLGKNLRTNVIQPSAEQFARILKDGPPNRAKNLSAHTQNHVRSRLRLFG